jgi:hypothetical protein
MLSSLRFMPHRRIGDARVIAKIGAEGNAAQAPACAKIALAAAAGGFSAAAALTGATRRP